MGWKTHPRPGPGPGGDESNRKEYKGWPTSPSTSSSSWSGLVEYDAAADPFPVTGWDAVVWVVGNATQAAHFYQSAFGMELVAYSGPETGNRDHHSYVLTSGAVRFVIKGGVDPDSPLLDHHRRHGDGVVDIALEVPDVDTCIAHARAAGRDRSWTSRTTSPTSTAPSGWRRSRRTATPGTPWSTGPATPAPTCPGYVGPTSTVRRRPPPKRIFQALDHVVGNVELGQMDEWVDFYNRVMGFTNMAEFIGDDIATDYSALMSKVVANGNHRVKFPLNEPAIGQEEVADRRVPRVLRRPRRAAPRPGHQRHPAHR